MTFSLGQSFFDDLLHYANKHDNKNELETTYALQSRAANWFRNKPYPYLHN